MNRTGAATSAPASIREAVQWCTWWAVRLLVLALAGYLLARLVVLLSVVTVPLIGAALGTALLTPVRRLVERTGMPRLPASLITVFAALAVLGGILTVVTVRATASVSQIVSSTRQTMSGLSGMLHHGVLGFGSVQLATLQQRATDWLDQRSGDLVGTAFSGINLTLRAIVGLVLTWLLTFLLVWDGERLWASMVGHGTATWSRRLDQAGQTAWRSVSGYVRGTLAIATFHGIVVGTALAVLGVPLAGPLAVAVFFGSFVPIVGALVAGGAAVLVTLATHGLVQAGIILALLLAANQTEAHVLQPLVMRRFVHLHPIVTVLSIAAFGAVGGVVGALIAVPLCSVVGRVVPVLLGRVEVGADGEPQPPAPADGGGGAAGPEGEAGATDPPVGDDPSGPEEA